MDSIQGTFGGGVSAPFMCNDTHFMSHFRCCDAIQIACLDYLLPNPEWRSFGLAMNPNRWCIPCHVHNTVRVQWFNSRLVLQMPAESTPLAQRQMLHFYLFFKEREFWCSVLGFLGAIKFYTHPSLPWWPMASASQWLISTAEKQDSSPVWPQERTVWWMSSFKDYSIDRVVNSVSCFCFPTSVEITQSRGQLIVVSQWHLVIPPFKLIYRL